MHFLPVLELMSDSLTAIQVEPNQCPSHQSILLTQGPIQEIFAKKFQELAILKNKLFFGGHFEIFFFKKKKFFLLHSLVKRSNFLGQQGWVEILMITLVFIPKQSLCTVLHTTVFCIDQLLGTLFSRYLLYLCWTLHISPIWHTFHWLPFMHLTNESYARAPNVD